MPPGEVSKRILCLFERKYLVDHWSDVPLLEEFAYFAKLNSIGARKEK